MKKLMSLMMALVLALGLCAFAGAEGTDISALTVTSPSGAPALALAVMAAENKENYSYIAADTIAAAFAGKEADFIIAPINAGAKLYKAGKSDYKLAAVVSRGNLFIAAQKPELKVEDLNGAKITLFGENTINAGASDTQALRLSDAEAIVVTAEPALTAAKMKNDQIGAIAVNDLFKQAAGMDGYAQAGLFVKAETLEAQPEAVAAFLKQAEEACGKCATDVNAVAEAAVTMEILPNAKVAAAAIPGCAIRFGLAKDEKELIEKTAAIDPVQFGGEVPADDFYYDGAE